MLETCKKPFIKGDKCRRLYIVAAVCFLTVAINAIDIFLKPPYALKSAIKVALFIGAQLFYYAKYKDERNSLKALFRLNKKSLVASFALGLLCYCAIVGAFFLLKDRFDFSGITKSATADNGITAENYVYVSLYIALFNSLLEESIFRVFTFIILKKHSGRLFAYLFSAFCFAIYHVGMMLSWLHIALFALELTGLAIGAAIFNRLDEKYDSIYPSWIVHMFANFGISTIGFILFGII